MKNIVNNFEDYKEDNYPSFNKKEKMNKNKKVKKMKKD